ncbi:MAG: serpin family protein [Synechococcales cyanobacterium T60_A2020_003]|nr:serpin family protein [Synechococcales cyanobacterium T60_A2020_003]
MTNGRRTRFGLTAVSVVLAAAGVGCFVVAQSRAIAPIPSSDITLPHQSTDVTDNAMPTSLLNSAVATAQNQFGFKLFSEVMQEDSGQNVVISPSSVAIALSMLYNGADGTTQAAIAQALELQSFSIEDVNQANAALITSLESADPQVKLNIANALWGNEGTSFEAAFLQQNAEFYQAEIATLNFADPLALQTINTWVSEQTQGKISEILSSLQLDDLLVLVNAIYFKGSWTRAFNPDLTSDRPFFLLDGREISHPQMTQSGEFSYLETDQFQAVKLPYGNGRMNMYVFLPRQTDSIEGAVDDFYSSLTEENWQAWNQRFQRRDGTLSLPRFTAEYDTSLNEALSALGMAIAFNPGEANFDHLSPQPASIDSVQHKTFIDVNEEGTEAAAATSVTIAPTSMAIPVIPPFEMMVNRPFFFAIYDDQTGTILFMGAMMTPQ